MGRSRRRVGAHGPRGGALVDERSSHDLLGQGIAGRRTQGRQIRERERDRSGVEADIDETQKAEVRRVTRPSG